MSKHAPWFEVDREGLRELQDGKPKSFLIRELVANALDENVKNVTISHDYSKGTASISVWDDSPEGFRNLKDAYTLFGSCYKRPDATKRGRFNAGEKEAFAICTDAVISTTKGTVVFDKTGRHTQKYKTDQGTTVSVHVKMTKAEYKEAIDFIYRIIPPEGINMQVSDMQDDDLKNLPVPVPDHILTTKLSTVALIDGAMRNTSRNTEVRLYRKTPAQGALLYEMGMPVCEIDCDYHIDVNQRVPMGTDRDTVSTAYLQDLFAEVLNVTHNEITEQNASSTWVRVATSDDRVAKDAVQSVIKQRYGDKVVVATPNDPLANDDAIASGYRVIHGSELSIDEWQHIKGFDLIHSSHDVFGHEMASSVLTEETQGMRDVHTLVERISRTYMGIPVRSLFVESKATNLAQYGDRAITFNVSRLGKEFFDTDNNLQDILNLVLHELCHEYGHHTEMAYHDHLTDLASKLITKAIISPEFFWAVRP